MTFSSIQVTIDGVPGSGANLGAVAAATAPSALNLMQVIATDKFPDAPPLASLLPPIVTLNPSAQFPGSFQLSFSGQGSLTYPTVAPTVAPSRSVAATATSTTVPSTLVPTATATRAASASAPTSSTATASAVASTARTATATSSSASETAAAPTFSVLGGTFASPTLLSLTVRSATPGAFLYVSVSGNPSIHYVDFMWIEDAAGVVGPSLTLTVPYIGGGASVCAVAGRGGLANSSAWNQNCQTYSYTQLNWCSGENSLGGGGQGL